MRVGVALLALAVGAGCPHRSPWPVDGEEGDAAADPPDAAGLPDARLPVDPPVMPADAAVAPPDARLPDAGPDEDHCSVIDGECEMVAEIASEYFAMGQEWHPDWGAPFAMYVLDFGYQLCPGWDTSDDHFVGDSLMLHSGDAGAYLITAAEDPDFVILANCLTDGVDESFYFYGGLGYSMGYSLNGYWMQESLEGFGMPDFAGRTVVALELFVEDLTLTITSGWVNLESHAGFRIWADP
jgi:hypothetical protein